MAQFNKSSCSLLILLLLLAIYLESIVCPAIPTDQKAEHKADGIEKEHVDQELDDLGLEYGRYLQEVVAALEEDKEFAHKLENASIDSIKSGAIADQLHFVNHAVRSKLDELKRIEIDRLRQLTKKEKLLKDQIQRGQNSDRGSSSDSRSWRSIHDKITVAADHIHHDNPHTFEVEDLHKLILKATRDLEEIDRKRREDFKKYEMKKELDYRSRLATLNETERMEEIKKHDEALKKHSDHPKVHHPGSKAQLEQVWEEKDHLPKQEFDPKTFFALHDVNSDGYLDPQEVEALLSLEIQKIYDPKGRDPNDDPNEMMEEYHRMREHIYKEADKDKDGLISRKEFLDMTARADFEKSDDEGWNEINNEKNPVYSKQELEQYQRQLHEYQQQLHAAQQQYQYQYVPMQPGHQQGYGYGPDGGHDGQNQHHQQQQQMYQHQGLLPDAAYYQTHHGVPPMGYDHPQVGHQQQGYGGQQQQGYHPQAAQQQYHHEQQQQFQGQPQIHYQNQAQFHPNQVNPGQNPQAAQQQHPNQIPPQHANLPQNHQFASNQQPPQQHPNQAVNQFNSQQQQPQVQPPEKPHQNLNNQHENQPNHL